MSRLPPQESDAESAQSLVDAIQRLGWPAEWDSVDGTGTITVFRDLLVVRHTPVVIEEVQCFVNLLIKEILSGEDRKIGGQLNFTLRNAITTIGLRTE